MPLLGSRRTSCGTVTDWRFRVSLVRFARETFISLHCRCEQDEFLGCFGPRLEVMLTQLPTPHLRCWAALEGTAAEDLDRQSLLSQIVGQPEARYEWMVEDVKVPSKWLAQPVMHRNAFDTWVVSALQGVAPLRTHGLLLAHKNHVYMVGGLPTAALLQHMTTLGPVSPPSLPYL